MARAETYTWLPLDEWARLLGYNLWHFNGIDIGATYDGYGCGGYWVQYPYQDDKTTRDELAEAIRIAEENISEFVGFHLLPDWNRDILVPTRFHDSLYQNNVTPRGLPKSIQLNKRHVIAGGRRSSSVIEAGVSIVRVDNDNDSFQETATLDVTTSVDVNEIRVYYPGENGSSAWEIRPVKVVDNGDGTVSISFPMYLALKREHIEGLTAPPVDGTDPTVFIDSVDVYRVYNDTTEQVQVVYAPDSGDCLTDPDNCQEISYGNCLYVRNHKLGHVVYNPTLRDEPDKVDIYYFSGWRSHRVDRPNVDLDPYWKSAIAYYAAGLLDKEVHNCCGGNESQLVSRWRVEIDKSSSEGAFQVTTSIVENLFGIATRGAWYAYQRAKGRKVV